MLKLRAELQNCLQHGLMAEDTAMRSYILNHRFTRRVVFVMFIVLVFITSVSFSYKYYTKNEASEKLETLVHNMANIRGAMDLVSLRQHNIQKIINVIDQYNKDMPQKEKLAIANEIHSMCMKYTNLNVDLICATITHESALTWQPDIVSPAGAMGLMQIMPETGKKLAEEEGITWTSPEEILSNPIYNIRLGCRYLSHLIQQYELDGGLAAYNGGEKRAKLWLEQRNDKTDLTLLWEETRVYVPSILKLYAQFQTQKGIL